MTPASGPRVVGRGAADHNGERAMQRAAGVVERADHAVVHDRVELAAQALLSAVSCVALTTPTETVGRGHRSSSVTHVRTAVQLPPGVSPGGFPPRQQHE
jgi:hypothetical protein